MKNCVKWMNLTKIECQNLLSQNIKLLTENIKMKATKKMYQQIINEKKQFEAEFRNVHEQAQAFLDDVTIKDLVEQAELKAEEVEQIQHK